MTLFTGGYSISFGGLEHVGYMYTLSKGSVQREHYRYVISKWIEDGWVGGGREKQDGSEILMGI